MFLEYIVSFILIWIGKIFTLLLNIVPVWWILYILNAFDINFDLKSQLDLYLLFFVCFLAFIIIWKKIFEKIYQNFFRDADWIASLWAVIKWLVWLISFKKLAEILKIRKNPISFMISLFIIVLVYTLSYKWITTFSDVVDYTFRHTDASQVETSNVLTWHNFSELAKQKILEEQKQKMWTWEVWTWITNPYDWTWLTFKLNLSWTWEILTGNLINKVGKGLVWGTYQLKHWFNVTKKRMGTIDVDKLIMSWNTNFLQTKEMYQRYFLLITLNLDKKPDYLKTYRFLWFPLEPISFNKATNLLYLIFVSLLILAFWVMILSISPIFDFLLIIFIRRNFDYWDIVWALLRWSLAIWLFIHIFTL